MGALNAVVWPKHLCNSFALCMELGYLDSREWLLSVR